MHKRMVYLESVVGTPSPFRLWCFPGWDKLPGGKQERVEDEKLYQKFLKVYRSVRQEVMKLYPPDPEDEPGVQAMLVQQEVEKLLVERALLPKKIEYLDGGKDHSSMTIQEVNGQGAVAVICHYADGVRGWGYATPFISSLAQVKGFKTFAYSVLALSE